MVLQFLMSTTITTLTTTKMSNIFSPGAARQKIQAADQTIVSETTLADTELTIPIGAGEKVNFHVYAITSLESVGPGQKIGITAPSGATINAMRLTATNSSGAALQTSLPASWAINGGLASGTNVTLIEGTIINDTTEGNVTVQFAQHTSHADDAIFKVGSYLQLTSVS